MALQKPPSVVPRIHILLILVLFWLLDIHVVVQFSNHCLATIPTVSVSVSLVHDQFVRIPLNVNKTFHNNTVNILHYCLENLYCYHAGGIWQLH